MTTINPIAAQVASTSQVDIPGPGGHLLTVGAGMEFANLSQAIAAASDNDVIAVQAGTYVDVSDYNTRNIITGKNVTIEGVGGMVHLKMGSQGLVNGKGLLDVTNGLTLKNFELSGATDGGTGGTNGSLYGNVAGIRLEGGNLTLSNVYIHDSQNGILGGTPGGVVTIDHSAFVNNGAGDGYTHNIYINGADKLTITNSLFYQANIGHEIKSRAAVTTISNNIIADGPQGTASYDIDLPNGGVATIANNVIEKGPNAANAGIIHYGGETQIKYANNSLSVTNNTIINDDSSPYVGVVWNQSTVNGLTTVASINYNTIYNAPSYGTGAQSTVGNKLLKVPANAEPSFPTAPPTTNAPILTLPTGPLSLTLVRTGLTVSGGSTGATITDTIGSNTIDSGAVGITLNENGRFATVTTRAGSHSTITFTGGSYLTSAGDDTIIVKGNYSGITASGKSTISDVAGAFNDYYLNGAETLNLSGGGHIVVGTTGAATVSVTSAAGSGFTKAAAGIVTVNQPTSGAVASATFAGGALSGYSNGNGIFVTGDATDSSRETLTFRGGPISDTIGAGGQDIILVNADAGTDTIYGFRTGIDAIKLQGFAGNAVQSVSVINGNTVAHLTNGTTVTLVGVSNTAAFSQASNTPPPATTQPPTTTPPTGSPTPPTTTPPPQDQSITLTASGQTVRGGAGLLTVVANAPNDTIIGGTGGVVATLSGNDTLSTVAGATDTIAVASNCTLTLAGTDTVKVSGRYNTITASGTTSVTFAIGINTVTGGAGKLTVIDTGGNTTIGGSGGVAVTARSKYSTVTTAAGSINSISLAGADTVTSNGTDTIAVSGNYSWVTANGSATITTSGYNYFDLNGTVTLTGIGDTVTNIGSAANVTAILTGNGGLSATLAAGGRLAILQAESSGTGGLSVSGAASVWTGGWGISVQGANSGTAPLAITFGAGTNLVTEGAAPVNYTFVGGQGGGNDTIRGFRVGVDTLNFSGSDLQIVSWAAGNGNTVGKLSDGTQITFAGVNVPKPGVRAAAPVTNQPTVETIRTTGNTWTATDAAASIIDVAGSNTFHGGIGGLTIQAAYSDTITTVAGAVDKITVTRDDTVYSAGNDTITVLGNYDTITATGTSHITIQAGGATITGGAGLLTITDNFGSGTIHGGLGGIALTEAGAFAVITTAAGASDTLTYGERTQVVSAGDDTVNVSGNYSWSQFSGASTINQSSGYNSYTLTGKETINVSAGTAVTSVGSASQTIFNISGSGSAEIKRAAGAETTIGQSLPGGASSTTISGAAGTVTAYNGLVAIGTTADGTTTVALSSATAQIASLGADTIKAGSGTVDITQSNVSGAALTFIGGSGSASLTAGSGTLNVTAGTGALSITFGSGSATVFGAGHDTYTFINGAGGGTDTIVNYVAGQDKLVGWGYSSDWLANQSVIDGNLNLTLSDSTHVILVGVSHL